MIGTMLQIEECFYSLQDLPEVLWLMYKIVFASVPAWETGSIRKWMAVHVYLDVWHYYKGSCENYE